MGPLFIAGPRDYLEIQCRRKRQITEENSLEWFLATQIEEIFSAFAVQIGGKTAGPLVADESFLIEIEEVLNYLLCDYPAS